MTDESIPLPCACSRDGCSFIKRRSNHRFKNNACTIHFHRRKHELLKLLDNKIKAGDDIENTLSLIAPLLNYDLPG